MQATPHTPAITPAVIPEGGPAPAPEPAHREPADSGSGAWFGRALSVSPERLVLTVCAVSWVVQMFFLCVPIQNSDEWSSWRAGQFDIAAPYWNSANPGEKWAYVERYSTGGRLGWTIGHLSWANLFPGRAGNTGFALSTVFSAVSFLCIIGAAGNLYGRRGLLLAMLLVSLSPYFLNYAVRILGTSQSVMWICVALWCLSSPRWGLLHWIGAGFGFGMGFAAHYGCGPSIASIAAGLAVSLAIHLFRRGPALSTRIVRVFVWPLFGVAAALVPLLGLEYWASIVGGQYLGRLTHHENLVWDFNPGPYGMWLRHVMELDPLLQVLLMLVLLKGMYGARQRPAFRFFCATLMALLIHLAWSSMDYAPPRAAVSVAAAAAIGVTAWFARRPLARLLGGEPSAAGSPASVVPEVEGHAPTAAPLSAAALIVSLAAAFIGMTLFRKVSMMPRISFTVWPVMVLGLTGWLLHCFPNRFPALIRGVTVLGVLIALPCVWGIILMRNYEYRGGQMYDVLHPHTRVVKYGAIRRGQDVYKEISRKATPDVATFGPDHNFYPSIGYDEELFYVIANQGKIRFYDLEDVLSPYEVVNSEVHYQALDPSGTVLPPPGCPSAPMSGPLTGTDPRGRSFTPRTTEARGIEATFPPARGAGERSMTIRFRVPGYGLADPKFGFEYLALCPYAPSGVAVEWRIKVGGNDVMIMQEPVSANARAFRPFSRGIQGDGSDEDVEITMTLRVPGDDYCPPVTCYVRRPYLQPPPRPFKKTNEIDGFVELIEADETMRNAYGSEGGGRDLYRTSGNLASRGIRWRTAPWTGRRADPVVFVGNFGGGPRGRIEVNGRRVIEFTPNYPWDAWDRDGYSFEVAQIHRPRGGGVQYKYSLKLPDGAFPAGEPLELRLTVAGGPDRFGWIGVRDSDPPPGEF